MIGQTWTGLAYLVVGDGPARERRAGPVVPDLGDEILAGCCVTHAGEVRHGPTRELLEKED